MTSGDSTEGPSSSCPRSSSSDAEAETNATATLEQFTEIFDEILCVCFYVFLIECGDEEL